VDSIHLAEVLEKEAEKQGKVQDILLQVNLAKEESKSGLEKEELMEVFLQVDSFGHLRIRGLMCMAPNYEEVELCRPLFREMYGLYRQVQESSWQRAKVDYLSMGMSHDYVLAARHGATMVRIGSALFGPRAAAPHNE
jgi:pyridoxal phosphate enzyme (YggS family)